MNAPAWLQAATAAAVTFALAMIFLLVRRRIQERSAPPRIMEVHVTPYESRPAFLTPLEQRFFFRLFQAVGSDYLICPKVRLADVIQVRGDAIDWRGAFNRVAAKHIDFLLTTPDTYRPVLAVELEDGAHFGAEKKSQDEWLDRALAAAGLQVLRIKVRRDYDATVLRRQVEQAVAQAVGT